MRCGLRNSPERRACRDCLAPLNATGRLEGLAAPWRPNLPRLLAGAAAAALATGTVIAAPRAFPARPSPEAVAATPGSLRLPERVPLPLSQGPGLARFEPARGCFLGAFVSRDFHISGDMARWEELTGKGHASYLRYVGYGQPFPAEWVRQVRALGAVPCLAWEPNSGLAQVKDDPYLLEWARAAAASGGPIFLRFASEMNGNWTAYHGDPAAYRAAFRLVARVMHREAPNTAMVWCPYVTPYAAAHAYYPGDEAVDWVGINYYAVHHFNGDPLKPAGWLDPTHYLERYYRRYAARKPLMLCEFAATHLCGGCGELVPRWAIGKMERLYSSLPRRFPRVKAVFWFSWDTLASGSAENNYTLLDDPNKLEAYRRLIANPYFLPRVPEGELWTMGPNPRLADGEQEAYHPGTPETGSG